MPKSPCTGHKDRNLLAHASKATHEELSVDYTDMIFAGNVSEIGKLRRTLVRKSQLKCRAVAGSLEEAVDRLFTFTRLPPR